MLILAIDTTTQYSSVAVFGSGKLKAEVNWLCQQNHSTELLPAIESLLAKTGCTINDVEAIAVATGPGIFNGLRVGLSVAKSLAYSLNIPVKGVSSFEAIALPFAFSGIQLVPLIKTVRGQFAAAFFEYAAGKLSPVRPSVIDSAENIARLIGRKSIFCGDVEPEFKEALAGSRTKHIFTRSHGGVRWAGILAGIASDRLEAGTGDEIAAIEPDYLKQPHITKPSDRKLKRNTGKMNTRAVLWDMDGVIVDSALFHLQAWQETCRMFGIEFSAEYFWQTFGIKNDSIVSGLKAGLDEKKSKELIAAKELCFRQLIQSGIKPLPGAIELILELKKHKVPMAIASSAPQENIKSILNTLDIRRFIKGVIGEENVTSGKPDPEVFLKAAALLKVEPKNCVVIEDAVPGIEAAKKAGMACLAVAGTNPPQKLQNADMVVDSLLKVNASGLLGLIK